MLLAVGTICCVSGLEFTVAEGARFLQRGRLDFPLSLQRTTIFPYGHMVLSHSA